MCTKMTTDYLFHFHIYIKLEFFLKRLSKNIQSQRYEYNN